MTCSLLLTNCLFCGLAALFLLPLLKHPKILTYRKGFPVIITIILILTKMLIPYEFSFTSTLASKKILPLINAVVNFNLYRNITIGELFLYAWLFIAILLLGFNSLKHRKLIKILSIVPTTNNITITQLLSELYKQNKVKHKPKVVQLNINTGPFIAGLLNPTIVLPSQLSSSETKFVLLHEFEHFKHRHILIKACIEIVTAIYWWNPVIWILRKEVNQALEMQADANVIQGLSKKDGLSYLDTLIKVSKNIHEKHNANLALSFTLKRNMVAYRVNTALKFDFKENDKKLTLFQICPLILSTVLLLSSFIFTFESYHITSLNVEGTFTVNHKSDYFLLRKDNLYDLYIDDKHIATIHTIPEDLSKLSIHK